MQAMIINRVADLSVDKEPLKRVEIKRPEPGQGEIIIKVSACGVCHTELDEIEGRTPPPFFPMVPGHQVVGRVVRRGERAARYSVGDRVGVAWIHSACGICKFCMNGLENLCRDFRATGRDVNGGYAEYMCVGEDFAHPIPQVFSDFQAAPLLCAGAIGYRSLKLCDLRDGQILGLAGFGASAHLVLKMVRKKYPRTEVQVLARSEKERHFARELGAAWAGDFGEAPPSRPHCIIDTTPAWKPVVDSLAILERGGRLVVNAIRKEDRDKEILTKINYPQHLWLEKEIKSVANVARSDVQQFLELAASIPLLPEVEIYSLGEANRALIEMKSRKIRGAKVLAID